MTNAGLVIFGDGYKVPGWLLAVIAFLVMYGIVSLYKDIQNKKKELGLLA